MKIARLILLIILFVTLVTASIIASMYAVANLRGAPEWADTRRNLEARGASFDPARFIPAPVPDDQNLALAPFFARLYQYRIDPVTKLLTFNKDGDANAARTSDTIPLELNGGSVSGDIVWQAGQTLDLAKFQRFCRSRQDFPRAPSPQSPAADVLLGLSRFGPLLDELAQAAASRPLTRFPINWTQQPAGSISLPHDVFVEKLVIVLRLRASASLALGQTEPALRDISLGLRLAEGAGQEPLIIGSLIDFSASAQLMQPVWEGLARQQWSAAQLEELQARLGEVNLLQNCRRAVEAERAIFILPLLDELRQGKDLNDIQALRGAEGTRLPWWMSALNWLIPGGWYDEGKALVSLLDQEYVIDPLNAAHHHVDARRMREGSALVNHLPVKPTTLVAKICLPVAYSVAIKMVHGQAFVDQAIVACALERYALDHQSYPTQLDALVPAYLEHVPSDVIDRTPLRFQRTLAGRYRLWEVGWNGRDENGRIAWQNDGSRLEETQGDWVWQYDVANPPSYTPPEG